MTKTTKLTPLLKRLQLGPMASTLPERIALARREQLDYASFLEIILSDEVNRRAHRRIEMRLQQAGFQETCRADIRPLCTSVAPPVGSTLSLWMTADGPICNRRLSATIRPRGPL